MSNFCAQAINPATGNKEQVTVLDSDNHTLTIQFKDGGKYPLNNPLQSCCWLHEGPACSCHVGNAVLCTECGHEVECHVTVRAAL